MAVKKRDFDINPSMTPPFLDTFFLCGKITCGRVTVFIVQRYGGTILD
jgi:hypothetical protein